MIPGKVIGNLWATRKEERLSGLKLLIVMPIDYTNPAAPMMPFVAADIIGAGIGERVIVVTGSSARGALGDVSLPIDATVVGIIDDEDLIFE